MDSSLNIRAIFYLIVLFLCIQGAALFFMGQPLISASGYIYLWENSPLSPETSQQISDWYTYSHVVHGFLFYLLLRFLFPGLHPAIRLLLALGIEITWEITENTPWMINQYRQQALAVGYSGDSALNSVCDSITMIIGFVIAWRMPILITFAFGLALEILVGYSIHDNLTFNILNFAHQFEFITRWQSGS